MSDKQERDSQIGKRIKTARKSKQYTQEKLAEAIGVEPQSISDMERGKYGPKLDTVIALCEQLDISADFLLMGKDPSPDIPSPVLQCYEHLSPSESKSLNRVITLFTEIIRRTESKEESVQENAPE